jgi:hypothetical protein
VAISARENGLLAYRGSQGVGGLLKIAEIGKRLTQIVVGLRKIAVSLRYRKAKG